MRARSRVSRHVLRTAGESERTPDPFLDESRLVSLAESSGESPSAGAALLSFYFYFSMPLRKFRLGKVGNWGVGSSVLGATSSDDI